jgi:uncharacterized membrane protein
MRPSWLITIALLTGCSSADLGSCPTDSDAEQLAGRQVVEGKCNNCHSSAIQGAQRQDAPEDLNFDDLATVRDEAESMYGQTESGSMPPGGTVTGTDLENMRIWLACDAPDVSP